MSSVTDNKNEFITLLRSVERDGANIDGLIAKLESSDFFTAPASTKFHGSYEGGLCDHCLCVYYNLCSLAKSKRLDINPSSIIIVSLLHDMSKMNFYRTGYRNKKIYSENGSKFDNGGRYDWVTEQTYEVIPEEERFIYGSHEETSEYMISKYIPLTLEESIAILHHMGQMHYDCAKDNIAGIFNSYPLALLLHLADMMAAYVDKA